MEKIKGDTLLKDCQLFIEAQKITYDIIDFLNVEDIDSCKSAVVGMSIAIKSLLQAMKEYNKEERCIKFFESLSIELVQHGFSDISLT